jgi:putative flippase GtrA
MSVFNLRFVQNGWQCSKFAIVGLLNTAIDAGLFLILTRLAEIPTLLAGTLSFLAGNLNSFVMNKLWTFDDRARGMAAKWQYTRFAAVSLAVMGVHQACLLVLHDGLGMWDFGAKGAGIVLGFLLGFALNRLWVFPHTAVQTHRQQTAMAKKSFSKHLLRQVR